jgi:hypothetical protein
MRVVVQRRIRKTILQQKERDRWLQSIAGTDETAILTGQEDPFVDSKHQ